MVENNSIVKKVPWSEKDSQCDIDILQILGSGHTWNVLGPGTDVKNIGFLKTKILGLRNAAGGIQISDSSKYSGDLITKRSFGIQMVEKRLNAKWSGFQMPFEYWTNGCYLVFLCFGPVFIWSV